MPSAFNQSINSENKYFMQITVIKNTKLKKILQKLQVKAEAYNTISEISLIILYNEGMVTWIICKTESVRHFSVNLSF